MMLSECCSAPPMGGMEEYGICGDCKDHCEFYDEDEEEKPHDRGEFSVSQEAIINYLIEEGKDKEIQ